MAHLSCVGETREGLTEILDRFEAAGIENVLALRGDPPRGEAEFQAPDGGLSAPRSSPSSSPVRYDFTLGGACFPEVHPDAPNLEADLAYLKTKVEAGAELPDHPALLRQPPLLRVRRRRPRGGHRRSDHPRRHPDRQLRAGGAICDLCHASIPAELSSAMETLGGDEEAEARWGSPTPPASAMSSSHAGRARHPLLRAQPGPGDPCGAERPRRRRGRGSAPQSPPPSPQMAID